MTPSSHTLYPIEGVKRTAFLKQIVTHPQIIVGDYSYYDDPDDVYNFEKNVLYLYDFMQDKLIIGKFCQIATGVRFLMNGAAHAIEAISAYPFKVFGGSWESASMETPSKGNTVIGHDVWIGNAATIMPGINVGPGAIIGTNSLVTKNVDPYTIVGGNPARLIRKRFDDETIAFLLEVCWWDWDIEKITQHISVISNGDISALRSIHEKESSTQNRDRLVKRNV